MFDKLLSAVFETKEDEKKVDASKPLGGQIAGSDKPFTVITPVQYNQQPAGVQHGIAISEEEKAEYDKYFNDLYESVNCPKPSYHELISIVEAFSELPENVRFTKALGSFKGKLTKEVAVETAEQTLAAVQNTTKEFNNAAQAKAENEIGAARKLLEQKTLELANLQKEVADLDAKVKQSEASLNKKTAAYNSYSNNLQQKIQKDINDLKTFL